MTTEKARTKHIDELHFEHRLWASAASFYADELSVYQKRLEEIAKKNSVEEARKGIEQFQNRFNIQKGHLDGLKHEINMHDQWLSAYAKENPVAIDHRHFADHSSMRDHYETYTRVYADLKREFTEFMNKWM